MPNIRRILYLAFFSLTALLGCSEGSSLPARNAEPAPYIVAVNNPLHYFAERLIDEQIEVRLPVPADIDPAQWQPSVEDLIELQGAQLVLLNGAGYSPWLSKVSLASNHLVVSSEKAKDLWIELQGRVTHSHGPGGDHAHAGYAVTTWMDMSLARVQAEAVASAISTRWPEQADSVSVRLRVLLADLDSLDRDYHKLAQQLRDRQLIYSHPVYQYFERRYELPGQSLHWEPDSMPSDEQWQALARIQKEGALFIWEAEPDQNIAARMNSQNLEYRVIDPAANRAGSNWLEVQQANMTRLQ